MLRRSAGATASTSGRNVAATFAARANTKRRPGAAETRTSSSSSSSSSRFSSSVRRKFDERESERHVSSSRRVPTVVCESAASSGALGGEGFYDESSSFGNYANNKNAGLFGEKDQEKQQEVVNGLNEQLDMKTFTSQGVRMWVLRESLEDTKKATFIAAEAEVNATVNELWGVVRNYEEYSDIFKNIGQCGVTRYQGSNIVHLDLNVGMQSIYYEVEAILKLLVEEEQEPVLERKLLNFSQVDGDFESLIGRWVVEPSEDSTNPYKSLLRLEFQVVSKAKLPGPIRSHIINQLFPSNVKALAKQAELKSMRTMKSNVPFADEAMKEAHVELPGSNPFDSIQNMIDTQKQSLQVSTGDTPYQYLGVSEVPLPFVNGDLKEVEDAAQSQDAEDAAQSQDAEDTTYPEITLENREGEKTGVEIHLRKLDNEEYVHSRVIASIEINAAKDKVWDTLTDYDNLPTILPNLVLSQRIESQSRTTSLPGRVKLRQIVFKEFMYLRFRAEALLDVLEKPQNEIQFKLKTGTFDKLQGKFILQSCFDESQNEIEGRTSLVYAVEIRIPRGIQTFALAPLVEKFAFEDVANNMALLRLHIEKLSENQDELSTMPTQRPSTSLMCSDFEVFEEEMRETFGQSNKTMPKKGEFRSAGRFDLERACYAHGGFSTVADRMGWEMQYQRKPRDYWQNFDNLRTEILDFIQDHNLNPKEFPPRRTFIEYNRMDIVRAYTKWSGPSEVASSLGLRHSSGNAKSVLPGLEEEGRDAQDK